MCLPNNARLPPSLKGRGTEGVRSTLALLLLATLACSVFGAAGTGPAAQPVASTATPAFGDTNAGAHTGQFDCEGLENGLRAYSGRVTVQPGGVATFKDYDGTVQTGAWTYDAQANTFTFSGGLALASAIYMPATDTLIVVFVPNARVVHAANGGMKCQRAVPGKTGPP